MKIEFSRISISSFFFRRRCKSLARLLVLFFLLIGVLLGFSLGFIVIEPNQLVFKIVPSTRTSSDQKVAKTNSIDSAQLNPRIHVFEKANNLNKLFALIQKHQSRIKAELSERDCQHVLKLKSKYESLIKSKQDQQKEEYKLDVIKKVRQKEVDAEDGLNETLTEEISYDSLSLITILDSDEYIRRDVLIQLLKYERVKLKSKLKTSIKTVKMLLDEYDSNKEFNIQSVIHTCLI